MRRMLGSRMRIAGADGDDVAVAFGGGRDYAGDGGGGRVRAW